MRTSVKFCRCPCSFLYCFLRFRWKTRILSPRPSPSTSAVTLAVAGLATVPGSPETASTSRNSTVWASWSWETTLSIFNTSPGATRYCLPPVRITAYINPPAQVRLCRCAPKLNSSGGNFRAVGVRSSPSSSKVRGRTSGSTATGRNRQTRVVYRVCGAQVNGRAGREPPHPPNTRSGPRREHVEENAKVVGNAAGQHKEGPRGMEVAQPVQREEDDAQRVRHAARAQPHHPVPADGVHQRCHRNHHKPALRQVNQRRSHLEPVNGKAFEDHPGHGQRPHNAEERPAHRPAQ